MRSSAGRVTGGFSTTTLWPLLSQPWLVRPAATPLWRRRGFSKGMRPAPRTFTCPSSLQVAMSAPTSVSRALVRWASWPALLGPPLFAAQVRADSKHTQYDSRMPPDSLLMAMVVETHGSWHAEGLALIREVAKLAAKRANRPWAEEFRRFMGKMSVVLQRHNAIMILSRIQT